MLEPILTVQGREMLLEAAAYPNRTYHISHVAVGGNDRYTPTPDQTRLRHEIQRVAARVEIVRDDHQVRAHVTAIVAQPAEDAPGDSSEPYKITEIGFFLSDGEQPPILFAICATSDKDLLIKGPNTDLLLAFELVLPDAPIGTVEIKRDAYFQFPAATKDKPGLVRFATPEEVSRGDATDAAVTPATLKLGVPPASEDEPGVVRLATKAEVAAGAFSAAAVTPATLKLGVPPATKDRPGVVRFATQAEVTAGAVIDAVLRRRQ